MDVLVAGAGAVGSFYGGKLHQAGATVSLVCRSDFERVARDGVRVSSAWDDFSYRPSAVVRSCAEYAAGHGKPDLLLVCLKVLPEVNVSDLIRAAAGPRTTIMLLQNGINIEKPVAQAFPENDLISGIVFVCLSRAEPGHTVHLDYGRMVLGSYPSGIRQRASEVGTLFAKAGVPVRLTDDITRERWLKLVWNAPFNPLSVLCGNVTTKEIMDSEECRRLARSVMEEVVAVAASQGVSLPPDAVSRNIEDTARMRPYKTSMCLDFEAGRPIEVEAILGEAVRIARGNGVAAPRLESLYALLSAADATNRGRSSAAAAPA